MRKIHPHAPLGLQREMVEHRNTEKREREREIYIYIYIERERERGSEADAVTCRRRDSERGVGKGEEFKQSASTHAQVKDQARRLDPLICQPAAIKR